MIRPLLAVLCCFLTMQDIALAQTATGVNKANQKLAVNDVVQAAKLAGVDYSDGLANGFLAASAVQSKAFDGVYQAVPEKIRVIRLASYLSAKDVAAKANHDAQLDADDFHWAYVLSDLRYSTVKVEGKPRAVLDEVELGGQKVSFLQGAPMAGGKVMVLPFEPSTKGLETAVFSTDSVRTLWTGYTSTEEIKLMKAATTKGCEVFINSTPQKAEVLFNGRTWYQSTNTSAVRDPGEIEVVVRLKGFKEWRARKVLDAGESWAINAQLIAE